MTTNSMQVNGPLMTTTKLGNWADEECYYVTVMDAGRVGKLLGPYRTHEAALADVDIANKLANEADPFACFYGYGTSRWRNGYPTGIFNDKVSPHKWTGESVSVPPPFEIQESDTK